MRLVVAMEVPGNVLQMPLRHPQLGQILLSVRQTGPELLHQLASGRPLRPREELNVETEPPALGEKLQGVDHCDQVTDCGPEGHEGVNKINNQLGGNFHGEYVL